MKSAEEFLRKVLPSKGKYCLAAFYKNKTGARHTWYTSIEELAKAIEEKDATAEAVYHACASYGDKTNKKGIIERTKENVQYLRSLYAEIDIRDEKGYQNAEEALTALVQFCTRARIPRPLTVLSGGGFHLYWPLKEDITREVWELHAKGLKSYAAKTGLKLDASITADCARILRTLGTANRKYENTSVELLHDAGPFDLSAFTLFKLQNPAPVKQAYTQTLHDANLITDKCNQHRILRDSPHLQDGRTWVNCARNLAQCIDGERLFHEYSSQDPRYNADEAAKKWDESVKFNNGVTCAAFEATNPSGCEGCPFRGKIKTPLHIGRTDKYNLPEDVAKKLLAADLPKGFRFEDNGSLVYVSEKQDPDGETVENTSLVHQFPLIVVDQSVSENTKEDFRITLEHWKPHDGWSHVHIAASDFLRHTEAAFGGKGVFGTDDKLLKRYVKSSLNIIAGKRAASMSYETFGWKSKTSFLHGHYLISADKQNGKVNLKSERVALTDIAARLADHLAPGGASKKGSFPVWRSAAQMLFAPGHEWQACTLLASFAAIVMPLCLQTEGGLVWSTYDYEGGTGKTLATNAAASVWGDYEALSTTSNDTPKSRLAVLGTLRHYPLPFDEMNRTDPVLARDFLQTFTTGREGTKMAQGGEQLQKHMRNWCTVMLTSSNQELQGAIDSNPGSKAMAARIFEVHAQKLPLEKKQFTEAFKNKFVNNPGYAGDLFIKSLVLLQGHDLLDGLIEKAEEAITERFTFGPQQRFKLAFLKSMYVAAHVLVDADILSFSPERIITWLLEENGFVNTAGTWQESASLDMTQILAEYMQDSVRNTLVVASPYHGKPLHVSKAPTDELAIRVEDTGNIFLNEVQLHRWLQSKDISSKFFKKELEKKHVIKAVHARRSLGAGTSFGIGQTWCVIINGRHPDVAAVVANEDNVIDLEQAKKLL